MCLEINFTNFRGVLGCGALVTYVIELSFLVSKSAHLSPNSRRFRFYGHLKVGRQNLRRQKYRVLTRDFLALKKSGLNTKAFSFFDQFQWKFAWRYFKWIQKKLSEWIFDFCLFSLFIARQNCKNRKNVKFWVFLSYK